MSDDLKKDNKTLRYMLFMSHSHVDARGNQIDARYRDDGQMDCNACGADFVKDSVEMLQTKMHNYGLMQLAIQQKNANIEALAKTLYGDKK